MRYSSSKYSVTLKTGFGVVQSHWNWRRSIDHIRLTIGRPFVSMLYHFQVICRWIIVIRDLEKGHLSSFKLVPYESLGAVTCSPSTVTMAISLTIMRYSASNYSVTLKTGLRVVQVHWKWRHFYRPCTTFHWSAIVNIALSGTVFELFDVEWFHDLEIWVTDVTQGHSNWYHWKASVRFPSRLP